MTAAWCRHSSAHSFLSHSLHSTSLTRPLGDRESEWDVGMLASTRGIVGSGITNGFKGKQSWSLPHSRPEKRMTSHAEKHKGTRLSFLEWLQRSPGASAGTFSRYNMQNG